MRKVIILFILLSLVFYCVEYSEKEEFYMFEIKEFFYPDSSDRMVKWKVGILLTGADYEDGSKTEVMFIPDFYVNKEGVLFLNDRAMFRIDVVQDSNFNIICLHERSLGVFGEDKGMVYILMSGRIEQYNPMRKSKSVFVRDTFFGNVGEIRGYGITENGSLWIGNGERIKVFNTSGAMMTVQKGMWMDYSGRVHEKVENNRIIVISEDGMRKKMVTLEGIDRYEREELIKENNADRWGNQYIWCIVSFEKRDLWKAEEQFNKEVDKVYDLWHSGKITYKGRDSIIGVLYRKYRERIIYGFFTYDINGNKLGRIDTGNDVGCTYSELFIDYNGNAYVGVMKENKFTIYKYSRIHYLPHVIDTLKLNIEKLRVDGESNVYYKSKGKWNLPPPEPVSTGGFRVKGYSYVPPKKIKETGFRIYKGDSLMGRWKSYYKKPLKEVKYLGEDSLRRYWVYVGMDGYWEVMRYGWDRVWKKYIWCWVLSSHRIKKGIPGIMGKDRIDIKRFRVGWDGHLYYRDKGRWYKQEDIQREEFKESEVKRLALIESKIHVKPYIEYEPVDSAEFERGIKITRNGKLIRKFKYCYWDTLYTIKNLG
ncbi:MAG: hypothetical protein J7K62_04020, partial [Thermoplasmata archaeon]|nr:hypothetical protein [Thermoplasmata archaeon]